MARLPTVGGDFNTWGTVLNEFLTVSHTANGRIAVTNPAAAEVPLLVTGAASQSANLFELRNNGGTLLVGVSATGVVSIGADVSFSRVNTNELGLGTDDALRLTGSGATALALAGLVSGDAQFRVRLRADGLVAWGSGAAVSDMQMFRPIGTAGLQFGGLASGNRYSRLMDDGTFISRMDNNDVQRLIQLQNFGLTTTGQGLDLEFRLGTGGVDRNAAARLRVLNTGTFDATVTNQDADLLIQTVLDGSLGEVVRFTSDKKVKIATGGSLEFGDGTSQISAATATIALIIALGS